jgi:hypothetical protein
MKDKKNYSRYFKLFIKDFGLKWVAEYERLTPKEKQITDRAYLKDIPNLIKKYWNKKSATE